MADTAVAVSKASEYQRWFHEAVTQADADPLDANADENLHQLHEQLHGDEPPTVLGGRGRGLPAHLPRWQRLLLSLPSGTSAGRACGRDCETLSAAQAVSDRRLLWISLLRHCALGKWSSGMHRYSGSVRTKP
jgi:hypothetical protein